MTEGWSGGCADWNRRVQCQAIASRTVRTPTLRALVRHPRPKPAQGSCSSARSRMFRFLSLALCFLLGSISLAADNKEQGRLENCGVVMQEILDVPDNIPQELLEKAECVIVIPSMTKVAFGVGGSYGRGAMVCRSGKTFKGPWGAPAMYSLEGGSFGLQLGGESTDVVLLVMNDRGVDALLSSQVKLGGA